MVHDGDDDGGWRRRPHAQSDSSWTIGLREGGGACGVYVCMRGHRRNERDEKNERQRARER